MDEKGKKCIIICPAPEGLDTQKLDFLDADYIVAVDSGISVAKQLGLRPDIIIGDFDSADARDLEEYSGTPRLTVPPEKDDTDFMLAVKHALGLGFGSLYIVGGIGGRLDHTLANAMYLGYISENRAEGVITDGYNRVSFAGTGITRVKSGSRYISLIPVSSEVCVTLRGFKYPLTRAILKIHEPYSVSNEISDPGGTGIVDIHSGEALIIECD